MVCITAPFIRSLTICSLAIVFLITGCNNKEGIKDKSYGDSLTIVTYHAPVDINPLTTVSGISAILLETIFDGLVRLDQNLELKPHLATSWETSKDGLKWTFYLRKEVTFHDGVEFTADDVKFTIEEFTRVNLRSPFAGWTANIKSINIKDRYAIDIVLKK
ncbi:MAG: ABC transporter substrate-binding protein, partial [Nitrospirota bacterium]